MSLKSDLQKPVQAGNPISTGEGHPEGSEGLVVVEVKETEKGESEGQEIQPLPCGLFRLCKLPSTATHTGFELRRSSERKTTNFFLLLSTDRK